MSKPKFEQLEKLNLNHYEAIIIASQHARHLNIIRLKQLEQLEEDPSVQIDGRKITAMALQDVLDGKVKFTRPDSM